jgi:hypothetical protein
MVALPASLFTHTPDLRQLKLDNNRQAVREIITVFFKVVLDALLLTPICYLPVLCEGALKDVACSVVNPDPDAWDRIRILTLIIDPISKII